MEEIFDQLPESFKKNAQFLIDTAFCQKNLFETARVIENFSKQCTSELEKDFISFLLQIQKEKINEGIDD